MAKINEYINKIRNAVYGKDVRGSIADGIEKINNEQEHLEKTFNELIVNAGVSNAEIVDARVDKNTNTTYSKLGDRLDILNVKLSESNVKSSEALAKAENPLAALNQAGYKINTSDLSEEVINAITGNTVITDSKGLDNNSSVDYPLKQVIRNGIITNSLHQDLKNAILDIKIIGAKLGKFYKLQYIGNGTTAWGDPFYGIVLHEYSKDIFSTTNEQHKIIISRTDYNFNKSTGIVTWICKNDIENIVINITIDFSKLKVDRYNLDDVNIAYSYIIDENCYIYKKQYNNLEVNRGSIYPFRDLSINSTLPHKDLLLAILDVKIINAKKGNKYRLSWLGNAATDFGGREYGIYIEEINKEGVRKTIIDRNNCRVEAPTKPIETRYLTSCETDIVASITIDYSVLTLSRYVINNSINNGYNFYIDESCYIYEKNLEKNKLIVEKNEDTYIIKSPYDEIRNIIWTFSDLGINEILHLKKIQFEYLSNGSIQDFQTIGTDWISPYNFSAKSNTINNSTITTGGNHGTVSGGGFRTAFVEYKKAYINGKELTNGIYTNVEELVLETKNNIASSNVINLDTGEGFRAVISEYITYKITPKNIEIIVTIKANEDIVFRTYAGPQISGLGNEYSNITFGGDIKNDVISEFPSSYQCGTKEQGSFVDRFICESAFGYVVCLKDKTVGINDLRYISNDSYTGQVNGIKVYIKNFNNVSITFNKNDSFYYNCVYSFNKKYNCKGALRAYKAKDNYIADFNKATDDTYFEVDINDRNKKVKIIESKNVEYDGFSSSLGVKLKATGQGFIKFILI